LQKVPPRAPPQKPLYYYEKYRLCVKCSHRRYLFLYGGGRPYRLCGSASASEDRMCGRDVCTIAVGTGVPDCPCQAAFADIMSVGGVRTDSRGRLSLQVCRYSTRFADGM